ncbi:hypothetical protein Tco_0866676 [Tanacetum coccineum]
MADVNVNAPVEQAPAMTPPTRTDDQILPRSRWMPVGKSNCYLDVVKSQSNPIYKIVVDILKHTNFFRAFTASSIIPSIYIQQFWDTIRYDKTTRSYSCQLDGQWLDLNKDTLRDALQITPPWRTLTTIINLCLMGKTSAFKRPRALVLQILWGVVNRANIDYAERMWEESTQSIHSFVEDKKNLALHTQGKKKANPLVIPSISAKGTKREVFGMPILNDLITTDIRGEQYYNAYLEKVAKHQRYLAGEEGSDPESPAPKPAKATKLEATKKSKPSAPKAAPVTKPAAAKASKSQQPKYAPAKPQEKKRKLVAKTSEAPSLAKRSKARKVTKKQKPKTLLQLIDEFVDEGVPENEPRLDDEETDTQRPIEESLKEVHDAHQGPLPPVVIREPDSGKFQPLPEVQGKGKEKVSHAESPSLYAELGLTDSDTESDKEVPPVVKSGAQDEGQAGPDHGVQSEGQAGSNPGDDVESQPQSSHVVHDGPNLEHMDLEATDASTQQNPKQMNEGFTATTYPNIQENHKLTVEE